MAFIHWFSRAIDYPLAAPRVMQISLTFRCNLACRMCSLSNSLPASEELSTAQIRHAIDEAAAYRIPEVLFTGGEPFLRPDIFELCGYVASKGMRSIITTNAAVPVEDIPRRLARSGVGHVHISVDGLEATHDFFRGTGVFAKMTVFLEALNGVRQGKFSVGIACTVMDNNIGELRDLFMLADSLGVDVMNFQPLVKDNGNFDDRGRSPFWVKPENIARLEEQVHLIKGCRTRHLSLYEEPSIGLLPKYYAEKIGSRDWRCFGGFKTVFICFSKGQPLVYSCHGICGNLDTMSLKQAWMSAEAWKLRRHSRFCRRPCLQSCYSQESAQSLNNLVRFLYQKN